MQFGSFAETNLLQRPPTMTTTTTTSEHLCFIVSQSQIAEHSSDIPVIGQRERRRRRRRRERCCGSIVEEDGTRTFYACRRNDSIEQHAENEPTSARFVAHVGSHKFVATRLVFSSMSPALSTQPQTQVQSLRACDGSGWVSVVRVQ